MVRVADKACAVASLNPQKRGNRRHLKGWLEQEVIAVGGDRNVGQRHCREAWTLTASEEPDTSRTAARISVHDPQLRSISRERAVILQPLGGAAQSMRLAPPETGDPHLGADNSRCGVGRPHHYAHPHLAHGFRASHVTR